jgi:hypothetical protein
VPGLYLHGLPTVLIIKVYALNKYNIPVFLTTDVFDPSTVDGRNSASATTKYLNSPLSVTHTQ